MDWRNYSNHEMCMRYMCLDCLVAASKGGLPMLYLQEGCVSGSTSAAGDHALHMLYGCPRARADVCRAWPAGAPYGARSPEGAGIYSEELPLMIPNHEISVVGYGESNGSE